MNTKLGLAVLALAAAACSPAEGDVHTSGGDDIDATQKAHDRQVCQDAVTELIDMGCPPGYAPKVQLGAPAAATDLEAVGISICGGVGYFVDADDVEDAQWVGTTIAHNSYCTVGCFAGICQGSADLCVADFAAGDGLCLAYCGDTDEESCRASVLSCNGIDPEDVDPDDDACGLEPSSSDAAPMSSR
jgi:hypothetical protein